MKFEVFVVSPTAVVELSASSNRLSNFPLRFSGFNASLVSLKTALIASEITPTKYGDDESPNACDIKICNASAVDRLVGTTTYWKNFLKLIKFFNEL